MNKRIAGPIVMVLAAALCVGLAVNQTGKDEPKGAPGTYVAGTYTATAQGFDGSVTVTATFSDAALTGVEVDAPGETPQIGGAAIPTLVDAAMAGQSPDVDGVTGATYTSDAVKKALESCFAQAKA